MSNFYGDSWHWWVGVVKELVDDSFVKVRIFGIHPLDESQVDSSDLPNALIGYPVTGGQTAGGTMGHNLQVDSWVYGFSPDRGFMQPVVLGVINGTSYSMSVYESNGGTFVGQPTGSGDTGGGSDSPNTGATTNIPGDSNAAKAYNYVYAKLQAEGSSSNLHLHTSALMGCLRVESPNVDPAIEGGYKGRAWGICQWLDPRRRQLHKRYGRTKRLDQQLDFMWWELNNTEKSAKRRWLSASNMPDAVAGFSSFERNGCWDLKRGYIKRGHPIYKKSLRFAYEIFNSYSYSGNKPTIDPQL